MALNVGGASSSNNAAGASSFSEQLSAKLAAAREAAGLTATSKGTDSQSAVLSTANSTLFSMTSLMQRVRSLSNQAEALSPNDKSLDALRNQVTRALGEFNTIASAANSSLSKTGATVAGSASTGSNADAKPLSLTELRSTLATMQTELHDNIAKVGTSITKAVSSGSSISDPHAALADAMAAIMKNPQAAFNAQAYGLKSGYSSGS